MAGKLDGKVAIITGAGRGIGREVALLFAREGAQVVANDLGGGIYDRATDTAPAEQTVADIVAAGGTAVANFGDVADMEQAEALVQTAVNRFGRLDILVNVAGNLRDQFIFDMTEEEWDSVIRVHLKGTFATTRFASAVWQQRREGGRLINFTSASGLYGAVNRPNYVAAKMGVWGFTLSCARALSPYGVTANTIAPLAATRMSASVSATQRLTSATSDPEAAKGTEMDPVHVAPPLVYLASDEGGWISGRCFGISGYRITLFSQITTDVVLQGDGPWTVDTLFERMQPTFGFAVPAELPVRPA